jgi:hypothetical protein
MGLMDDFTDSVARVALSALPRDSHSRIAALYAVKGLLPEDPSTGDLIGLAHYVITGVGEFPDEEALQRSEARALASRDVDSQPVYPHPSGDVLALGPEVFADEDKQVINWRGENFYATTSPLLPDIIGMKPPPPLVDLTEPAPMAGEHWRGRRGGRPPQQTDDDLD